MRRARGFTLIELVLALTILGTMLLLLYSGLSFALRSWDAGDLNGQLTVDRRIGANFLRRELSELFPMRWKDPTTLKLAFEGDTDHLRFVSSRPAGIAQGGLSLVAINVEADPKNQRQHNLVMRRAMPDDEQKDFAPVEKAESSILIPEVDSVAFSYFGAENDFAEPAWTDSWKFPSRIPLMIRLRVKAADGTPLPEMVMKVMLGEEAGCLENSFQRLCRPRRQ
ncbi:MAG TPA: prepilin-type N-terminal cleavage/methylation domain-containing protein [Usitatibacter sp.]|nr:prepilin-type N-terminal cleavage/methylation domain-containing protein [Usitatibacter sp.]